MPTSGPDIIAQINREASEVGAALKAAKQRKMNRYLERCTRAGIDFMPLAVETLGGWEADAVTYLRAIAQNVGRRSDKDSATSARHQFQRLAITLQRGNAILLASRRSHPTPPHVTGDE